MREVDVLRGIRHPCIAKILEVVETQKNVSIKMEYAAGGDLFEQVSQDNDSGMLVEHNAKNQFYQIAHAISPQQEHLPQRSKAREHPVGQTRSH